MNRYTHILFDLDGTISDTSEGIYNCTYRVVEEYGFTRPKAEDMPKFIGPPLHESLLNYVPEVTLENVDEVVECYRKHYFKDGYKECRLYDGMFELLKFLHENGFKVALATAKPESVAIECLDYLGVKGFFDVFCGLTAREESKTQIVKRALAGLHNPDKNKVLMVGDRDYDAIGAKENGIASAGVAFGFGTEEEFTLNGAVAYVADCNRLKEVIIGDKN